MSESYIFHTTGEVVEAYQLLPANADEIRQWCGGRVVAEIDPFNSDREYVGMNVPTLAGMVRAQQGDWIVKRPGGDFYTRSSQHFSSNYSNT